MRALAIIFVTALMAAPAAAQGRRDSQGIPPGQMPPDGLCRVWYDGRPPGQQPRATNCDEAERVASRNRNARVIYGSDRNDRNDRNGRGVWRDDDRNDRRGGNFGIRSEAYTRGYEDGLQKGREDARGNRDFDPVRHSWYRNANRGYDNNDGSRERYRVIYREAFEDGYQNAYRANDDNRNNRDRRGNGSIFQRWP